MTCAGLETPHPAISGLDGLLRIPGILDETATCRGFRFVMGEAPNHPAVDDCFSVDI